MSSSISFHLTEKPYVMCHDYGTKRSPILAVQDSGTSLTLYARDDLTPAEQLAFARELLAAVTEYAAAVETYTGTETTHQPT
ncbi:hypothetical protein [Streptomyces sp. MUM 178J]|uniref:hypothetical protein n=1 Tax=Streptomyces sp. MUM 178J TaxID=2791991 RepID=UPI001F04D396|nr:hypothetical protein [Streptomyces sp. MUM 178J]WRQ82941.1 hypothetical protein I3F59_028325 [Streptomyces sp. MUM 178J]